MFNARSIANKQSELNSYVHSNSYPDIISISETWLNSNVRFTALGNNYNIFRQDRTSSIGGGILLALRNNLKYKFVDKFSDFNCECVIVDVQFDHSNYMRYIAVYRPPDTPLEDSAQLFDKLYTYIENTKFFTVLGDFNFPDIDWENYIATTPASREFISFCLKSGLHQLVNFPTRNNHILDLILCSDERFFYEISCDIPFSTSDHNSIMCTLKSFTNDNTCTTNIRKPCFAQADFTLINAFLSTIDWEEVFRNCNDVNQSWLALKNVLDTVIFNFVPFVDNAYSRKDVPWFSTKLRRLRNIKQRRWQKYKHNRNIVLYANYKDAASKFRSEFLLSKCNYEKKLFDSQNVDPKRLFNYIKKQNSVVTSIPSIKTTDGNLVTSDFDKSNVFSEYFSSVFVNDNGFMPNFQAGCTGSFHSFTCNVVEIIKIVKKLSNNSAPGPDGYTPFFLKNIIAHVANPLAKVYNHSLSEGKVPSDWKIAHIIPIFKKGDAQKASNYRPVSLTSIICKVLERIVRKQILDYAFEHNIFPKDQHGFLPKRSTVTNMLECLDKWTQNFDNKYQTDVIYLDYSKCFDTVVHSKLLFKLSCYGFQGTALQWLKCFLSNRSQIVKVGNTLSNPQDVISGVPQGTVLGPVLFLFYSADLQHVIRYSKLSMYADDTKLFKKIESFNDCLLLQEDLTAASNWAKLWQLKLNPDKTHLLTIGITRINFSYSLDGSAVAKVDTICDIGINVQSNLKYTNHCNKVIRNAHYSIRNIFNTFKYHSADFYVKLYVTYVRPILEGACQVWAPSIKDNIDNIEKVQRFFTRRLPGMKDIPYLQRLTKLNLEPLERRRMKHDLVFFYKMINGKTVVNLDNSFRFIPSYRGHNKTLFLHYSRTDKRKYFYINRIVSLWNSLPYDCVNANAISSFKKKLEYCILPGRGSIYCV